MISVLGPLLLFNIEIPFWVYIAVGLILIALILIVLSKFLPKSFLAPIGAALLALLTVFLVQKKRDEKLDKEIKEKKDDLKDKQEEDRVAKEKEEAAVAEQQRREAEREKERQKREVERKAREEARARDDDEIDASKDRLAELEKEEQGIRESSADESQRRSEMTTEERDADFARRFGGNRSEDQ